MPKATELFVSEGKREKMLSEDANAWMVIPSLLIPPTTIVDVEVRTACPAETPYPAGGEARLPLGVPEAKLPVTADNELAEPPTQV